MITEYFRCSNHNVGAEQWPPQPGLKFYCDYIENYSLTELKILAR